MASQLPACSAFFKRAVCPHMQLFGEEYKRCFPHCCPCHIDRSYCGSPLEVEVRLGHDAVVSQWTRQCDQALSAPLDVADIFVFARFEEAGSALLSPAAHSLHYLRSVSCSDLNLEAAWFEGVRQPSTERQLSRLRKSPDRTESATFLLNGEPYDKWYYHWDSGANKRQRATKHVLRAYVFYCVREKHHTDSGQQISSQVHCHQQEMRQTMQEEQPTGSILKLLCVVVSPPFTVTSYRRSPSGAASTGLAGSPGLSGISTGMSRRPPFAVSPSHFEQSGTRPLQHQQRNVANEASYVPLARIPPRKTPRLQERQGQCQLVRNGRISYQCRQFVERDDPRFQPSESAAILTLAQDNQTNFRGPRTKSRYCNQNRRDFGKAESGASVSEYKEGEADDEDICDQPTVRGRITQECYESTSAAPVLTPHDTAGSIRVTDKALNYDLPRFQQQQQHDSDVQLNQIDQLTDLAVIHFFVSHVTTRCTNNAILATAIEQHWHCSARGAMQLTKLLHTLSSTDVSENVIGGGGSRKHGSRFEELMVVLGAVCVWAFSPANFKVMESLLEACYPLLLANRKSNRSRGFGDEGNELHAAYVECAERCFRCLNGFLQTQLEAQTSIRSVHGVSDAIVGAVYSDQEFKELRLGMRAVLQGAPFLPVDIDSTTLKSDRHTSQRELTGWRCFVAQVREGYLLSERGLPWNPTDERLSCWTAEWLLQVDSLTVASDTGGLSCTFLDETDQEFPSRNVPSIWTSCLVTSQLLHLKLMAVRSPVHSLYVQAKPSLLSRSNSWLQLICDGRVRVAPVLSNGFSGLMCGGSCSFGGDYIACTMGANGNEEDDSSGTSMTGGDASICVKFYWWPRGQNNGLVDGQRMAFRSVVTLHSATRGTFIAAQTVLERGRINRESIAAAMTPQLELWTPRERIQAVATWQPWLGFKGLYARK